MSAYKENGVSAVTHPAPADGGRIPGGSESSAAVVSAGRHEALSQVSNGLW
jgi:hypothetical protein